MDQKPIQLAGFNNLTKALSFNLYDFCAARDESEREAYVAYVAEHFNAKKVTEVLKGICNIIEAEVLSVSDQDYDPWGASSLVLMSDLKGGAAPDWAQQKNEDKGQVHKAWHLDKSHICAHTYPDFVSEGNVCSFRLDIDIATCGEISPLKALNYMFEAFDSDVVVIDYVVRGFTRDKRGKRIYMDHVVKTIQDYIKPEILKDYQAVDLMLQSDNIWQTKLLRTRLDESTYFLNQSNPNDEDARQRDDEILRQIKREMRGVLYMWPD